MGQNKLISFLLFCSLACQGQTIFTPTSFTPTAGDKIGWSCAAGPNFVIFGATEGKVGSNNKQGYALVYDITTGTELKRLTASDGAAIDYYGVGCAVNPLDGGNTIVVGAYGDNIGASTDVGSAYVYYKNYQGKPNIYTEVKKLISTDTAMAYGYYGESVSVYGDWIAIGGKSIKIGSNSNQGAVYMYNRDAGGVDNWGGEQKLTAPDGAANNYFGVPVSLVQDYLFVGARGFNSNRGKVYIYKNVGGTWTYQTAVQASDNAVGDQFGAAVSASTNATRFAVGAPSKSSYQGKVYIFEGSGSSWSQTAVFQANDPTNNDRFGTSVALQDNYLAIGVPVSSSYGAVYVFGREPCTSAGWTQESKTVGPSAGGTSAQYGYSLAWWGTTVLVGANLSDVGSTDRGAGYKQ